MLENKIAVITGGGRGIGRSIAKVFLGYGSKVIALDKVFPDDFESFDDEYRKKGLTISSKVIDVTNTEELIY